MIKKIVAFALPLMMIVAIILKFNGVEHIELGNQYYNFMRSVIERNNVFTLSIPNIPTIPSLTQSGGGWDILKVVVDFFNNIVNVINVLLNIVNMLISTLTFVLNMIVEFGVQLKNIFYPTAV